MLPTLGGVLLLTFVLFNVVGGSPAEIVLGKNASADALAEYDARHGYDRPLIAGRMYPIAALSDLPPDADDEWWGDVAVSTDPGASGLDAPGGGSRSNAVALPLGYALPAGRYTLRMEGAMLNRSEALTLRIEARSLNGAAPVEEIVSATRSRRGSQRDDFEIPEGLVGERILLVPQLERGQALSAGLSRVALRRRTRHLFDSQLAHYVVRLVRGDLGFSTEYQQPVIDVIRLGIGPSLCLTFPILLLGTGIGVLVGLVAAALRNSWWDRGLVMLCTALMSVNYVVWVLVGQYVLAFRLGWFPVWGFESLRYLVLPVLIGIVSGLGRDVRFYRTVMLDEMYRPHVRTAYAKGISAPAVLVRHVLRNAMIPVVTKVSMSLPFLFTGSILLEGFYGIPGLGGIGLNAIHSSDMDVLRAIVLIGAMLYMGANLLADLLYVVLDPRVRMR